MATVRQWMAQRATKERENMRLFVLGAFIFFFGLSIIVFANQLLLSSVRQEIIVLCGLIITIIGGLCAAAGYIAMSVFRIVRILDKK